MIISKINLVVGAIGGAILALGAAAALNALVWRPAAVAEGRDIERAAQLKESMELLQKRNHTNAEIRDLDPAELCRALGGRWMLASGTCE